MIDYDNDKMIDGEDVHTSGMSFIRILSLNFWSISRLFKVTLSDSLVW